MSRQRDHRLLVEWLRAQETTPVYLDEVVARTRHARQRPAWSFPERWLPMQLTMRPAYAPRVAWLLPVVALLIALAGAAAVLIGSRRDAAPPFGLAANGSILLDVDGRLWLADADGSNPRGLETGLGRAFGATFSPDGTKLAFFTQSASGTRISLFVANADGSGARNVTGDMTVITPETAGFSWSPDGSRIVFSSFDSARARLYVAATDGSGTSALSGRDGDRAYPVWSPDGQWIAYLHTSADRPVPVTHLAVAHQDGSGERLLRSVSRITYSHAAWSADSTRIAYVRHEGTGFITSVIDLDGNERIVAGPEEDAAWPAWSPDGSRLAYARADAIVVTEPDGEPRITVPTPFAHCGFAWAPDGTAVLGLDADCTGVYRIPLDKPEAATRLQVPEGAIHYATWQRVAP